jgi:hypothetical protein
MKVMQATAAAVYLDYFSGDRGFGDLTWDLIEPGKLARAKTPLGTYSLELQADGNTYQLSFKLEFARRSFRQSTGRNGKPMIIIAASSLSSSSPPD